MHFECVLISTHQESADAVQHSEFSSLITAETSGWSVM